MSKEELLQHVISAFEDAGCVTNRITAPGVHPMHLSISYGEAQELLIVYIWNITHGGQSRSEDEYRIQVTGVSSPLLIRPEAKTLLLGLYNETGVFAAFDPFLHQVFGSSASIQVSKIKLDEALTHSMTGQQKETDGGKEIVATFKPSYILEYIQAFYPAYHAGSGVEIEAVEAGILENPLDVKIPEAAFVRMSLPRRQVFATLNRKVREKAFQLYVTKIYSGACAICGLQAKLVEAAHIVPVGDDGTDEITNGILFCRNHHRAYDMGLLAISPDYAVLLNPRKVSQLKQISQTAKLDEFIALSRVGEKIVLPNEERYWPNKESLAKNCRSKSL